MTVLAQSSVFSWALQWGKYGTGTIAAQKAQARVDFSANVANNDTLTISTVTYTYKTALSSGPTVANEIHIGATLALTIANTVKAINAGAGIGTDYSTGTVVNPDAVAVAAYNSIFLTAAAAGKAGNLLGLAKSSTVISLYSTWKFGYSSATFDITALSYSRHRVTDLNYDVSQDGRPFALELSSAITPTGYYKAGAATGGGATLAPRFENTFGELLLALCGNASVVANSPVSGAYTHTFNFVPGAPEYIPWVTVRRHAPGRDTARPIGLTGVDNVMAQMRIMIPQNEVLQARVDFTGRVPVFDPYSDAWLYQNAYEGSDKAGYSCSSSFKLPSIFTNALPVTSVIIEIVNNTTTPAQEMVLGSYYPDDYVVRTRVMRIRFVYKWADPELYERSYTNAAAGTAWSPVPFITNYSAGNYAFQVQSDSSQAFITGTTPYSFIIRAGSVAFEPVGPLALQAGGILAQEYSGLVLEPAAGSGVPYFDMILVNGRSTAYSIPAQP